MEKYIKKMMIIGGSILLCMALGTYAATIINSDSRHYRIGPGPTQAPVCVTGPVSIIKYDLSYDNADQSIDLFVPKNTAAEFNSFIDAASGSNSFGVTDVYSDFQNICGAYNSCNYGSVVDNFSNCPSGYADRKCRTACYGDIQCGGPC